MYQYKGVFHKSRKVAAEGHTIEDIEQQIVRIRREQLKNNDGGTSEAIEIIHVKREGKTGHFKEEFVKLVHSGAKKED